MTKLFVRIVSTALAFGCSTGSFAGGDGRHPGGMMMIRPPSGMHGGHYGGYAGHAGFHGTPMRVYGNSMSYRGHGTSFYGHVNTAQRGGYVRRYSSGGFENRGGIGYRYGYGHVNTGWRDARSLGRYAWGRRHGYGYRYGERYRYPGVYGAGTYGAGAYGSDYGSYSSGVVQYARPSDSVYVGGDQGRGDVGSTDTGYAGEPLQQGYAEPPLNAVDYGGGPRIIVVHGDEGRREPCSCRGSAPVVYRFGVGSYY